MDVKHYFEYSNDKINVNDSELEDEWNFENKEAFDRFVKTEFHMDLFSEENGCLVSEWCLSEGIYTWYRSKIIFQ